MSIDETRHRAERGDFDAMRELAEMLTVECDDCDGEEGWEEEWEEELDGTDGLWVECPTCEGYGFCLSPEAEAWLWIAEGEKRPAKTFSKRWLWFDSSWPKPKSHTPMQFRECLYVYESLPDAYNALVAAYVAARREGWTP